MKRIPTFAAGMLTMALLGGLFTTAKNAYQKIDVLYNDVKIILDGETLEPTDAVGNPVEPFIYNGTTYLPVRAVATAFDKEVAWDEETFTVTLTSKVPEDDTAIKITQDDLPASDDTAKAIVGKWQCDVTNVLSENAVPDEILAKYPIFAIIELSSDGKYKLSFSEDCVDNIVSVSFEYALIANGIAEEDFENVTGMSVENFKAQLKASLAYYNAEVNGRYKLYEKKLLIVADNGSEEVREYALDGDRLTLSAPDGTLELVRVKG